MKESNHLRNKIIAALGAFMLSAGAMQAQTSTTTTAPIDINTASRMQLADAGWGQYADAIIAARPYKSMNDLVEKKVVPPTAYEKGFDKFQIGNTTEPLNPNSSNSNPTTAPAPVTPPNGVTPSTGVMPPTGTTPAAVAQPGATPPTVQPGAPVSPTPAASTPATPASPAK